MTLVTVEGQRHTGSHYSKWSGQAVTLVTHASDHRQTLMGMKPRLVSVTVCSSREEAQHRMWKLESQKPNRITTKQVGKQSANRD